ncbi:WD repeat-containing protein 90 [Silurus meridionalis]|nr:WD repeat-containing protein 90 [Silurus meridionalis]
MASKVWQHPYVNVFKHVKLDEWRKAGKEGDVTTYKEKKKKKKKKIKIALGFYNNQREGASTIRVAVPDKTIKCTVFRIRGSILATNYILIPKSSSQSLGLTGRYLYLLFRPCPNKHFVVHLDVAAEEGRVIRVSFEFKSTATWLQFPFVCSAAPGSVYETTAKTSKEGLAGPAPVGVRWTCLTMDLRYVLSVYLNRTHSHLKSVKLCANMAVKNLVTSDLLLDPGLTFSEVRQAGVVLPEGTAPMPRDMCLPVPKGISWHQLYDYIRFPSDGVKTPFNSIQKEQSAQTSNPHETLDDKSPYQEKNVGVAISNPVQDCDSLIQQITAPKPKRAKHGSLLHTSSLPELAPAPPGDIDSFGSTGRRSPSVEEEDEEQEEGRVVCDDGDSVHVYAHYEGEDVMWARDGEDVVYPCHAIIISMNVSSGQQRFFIGHTDKVSALALDSGSSLLASAQTGTHCLLRLWSYSTGEALTVIKTHTHSLHSLRVLCGVGRDGHNKTTVVVWDTQHVLKGGFVTVLAKAHTDVDIQTMKIAFFEDTRMVSCGAGNVRLWRVRGRSLCSCPVDLGQYHGLEFTDLAFESGHDSGHAPGRRPDERTLFVSSRSGHILEIDYATVTIQNIRRILQSSQSHAHRREKQTFGTGIAVNSISVCSAFCATGSDDGFLRLWPPDFSSVLLEAEHEGPVSLVCVSSDGLSVLAATTSGNLGYLDVRKHEGPVSLVCVSSDGLSVLAATTSGNLGYLDVRSRAYRTLMRSHTDSVLGFSVDASRRRVTTASRDGTVRIWDADSSQQMYDFVSDDCNDTPSSVAFHPRTQVFACGSSSGTVRVFDIPTSNLLAEHKQHRGEVVGLAFAPSGEYLYSAGSRGYLALYSASQPEYNVLRVQGNMVVRGSDRGPDALAVSPDSKRLAFVGPTEHTVTVTDARTLDKLLRVDVSVLDVQSVTLDSALKVRFSPSHLSHLLVTTSANKILWISGNTGRLLREVSHVHKDRCTSLSVSEDGRYLLTAGHHAVKVWDYDMKLDIKSQVFIGHSEPIRQVSFTPDQMGVVSVGDAIFFWDFLGYPREEAGSPGSKGKSRKISPPKAAPVRPLEMQSNRRSSSGMPRQAAPRPSSPPPVLNKAVGEQPECEDSSFLSVGDYDDVQPKRPPASRHASFLRVTERGNPANMVTAPVDRNSVEENRVEKKPSRPDCYKHFTPRYTTSGPDPSAVTPPLGQESLSLKAVIGYNGNGRSNVVWNPDTGLFVYSCGCVVVVENLHNGSQRHWLGHSEEISTLAATHDAQTVASASGGGASSKSLICIWNVQDGSRRNSILYHKGTVQSLAFSRDDLYFLSVGGFEESTVALWSTHSFELVGSVSAVVPLHEAAFCPSSAAQLAYVGSSTVFFCYLHTHGRGAELQVRAAGLPEEIGEAEVTSLCYNANLILYTGTNSGRVCVWDCSTHRCFMTWEADDGEIGVLVCRGNRLLTGSNSKKVKLWAVAEVQSLRPSNLRTSSQERSSRVLLEQEMVLDGTVVSAVFDDVMDMGIVGVCERDAAHRVSGGYSDGSVRIFCVASAEMVLKLQPHGGAVSALQYSLHGQVLLSGGRDGIIVVSSPSTGASLRIIGDHKGAPINALECTGKQYKEYGLEGDELWLAVSADRRVSVWAADWTKDKCELLDWLTFPAPAPPQDAASLPPSQAAFSTTERGIVVYTGTSRATATRFTDAASASQEHICSRLHKERCSCGA